MHFVCAASPFYNIAKEPFLCGKALEGERVEWGQMPIHNTFILLASLPSPAITTYTPFEGSWIVAEVEVKLHLN